MRSSKRAEVSRKQRTSTFDALRLMISLTALVIELVKAVG
ncbi:hypothetical protein ABH935_009815 [Catenulispora sp. GAS73]